MSPSPKKTVKLLKVVLQVHMVIEDEGGLSELVCDPLPVAGGQWKAFSAEGGGFDQAIEKLKMEHAGPPVEAAS